MIHKTFLLTYYWFQSILQIQAFWDKDWQKLVIKSHEYGKVIVFTDHFFGHKLAN